MSVYKAKPKPFFEIIIHDIDRAPGLTGASAGYECKQWRNEAMADYLFEWLPEFALKYSDLEDFNSSTGYRLLRDAARTVYTTEKYAKRGEFGELLLHALIRQVFDSEPAISKIFYKSSMNETVKGFDAVHIVRNGNDLELWLGEAKFYKDIAKAVSAVAPELQAHTQRDYLRDEFVLIDSKIDPGWQHAEALRDLISNRTSLDEIFKRTCLPVLLTYESPCVDRHVEVCEEFQEELAKEFEDEYHRFIDRSLPPLRIHLFLIPLDKKKHLVEILQEKLEGLQR